MSNKLFKSFTAFRNHYANRLDAFGCIFLNHVHHYIDVQKYMVMYLGGDDKWHTDIYNAKINRLTEKMFDTRAEQKQFLTDFLFHD